jgi:hypothetical protein
MPTSAGFRPIRSWRRASFTCRKGGGCSRDERA